MIIKIYFTYKHDEHTAVDVEVVETLNKQEFVQSIYESKGFWFKPEGEEFFIPWHKINSFERKK